MGKSEEHAKLAEENLSGAKDEFEKGRYANVGLLALRALEQIIEACVAREAVHFHEHPRTAHRNRRTWLQAHHPDLTKGWDILWSIYGALGYGGVDGGRAKEALRVLDRVIKELRRREGFGETIS